MKRFLRRWGPALAMMAVIFAFSSLPRADIPGPADYWSDFAVKKLGHLLGYGLLGAALLRGLADGRPATRRAIVWAVALAALYGVSDEWHQTLAPGREPRLFDVLVDTLGATLGVIIWLRGRVTRVLLR